MNLAAHRIERAAASGLRDDDFRPLAERLVDAVESRAKHGTVIFYKWLSG